MTTHTMKLRQTPFELIQRGEKTIECRLYDEKRRKVQLGDSITFSLMNDDVRKVTVRVIGLLRYETFTDMFARNTPQKFGGKTVKGLTESLLTYYDIDEQHENGVLGIEFELL